SQKQAVAFEETDLRILQIQMHFLFARDRSHGAVQQVEIAADLFDHCVEAASAYQLDARVQVPVNPNLTVDQLRRRPHLQRLNLPELARMEIERPRRVALPDARLAYREFVNVKKHRSPERT